LTWNAPKSEMSQDTIHEDMLYLAGRLPHRGAQTEAEREAALYIKGRLEEHAPDTGFDEFHAIDNYPFLFAAYYAEFFLVALVAIWFPLLSGLYGSVIFVAYLAEFMGYRVLARLLPQFDTQNVVARFLALRPRKLIVVTAHYDSGAASPLSSPILLPLLRPLHLIIVCCMVLIIAACAADALALRTAADYPGTEALRWSATGVLAVAALFVFLASGRGEHIRGAITNASGVAALLQLAEELRKNPVEEADVWLVATGSHASWMSGMRHLLDEHKLDKGRTCILNLEGVGGGQLHYLTAEGMLHRMHAAPALRDAAEKVGPAYDVTPATLRAIPTAAHAPLARGYQAMSIMGLDSEGLPPHWNQPEDRLSEVDEKAIATAAAFTAALIFTLAVQPHEDGAATG